MAMGQNWTGKAIGTNVGNVFLELSGDDAALTGVLRFNDLITGIVAFSILGHFTETKLFLKGKAKLNESEANLSVECTLVPNGNLEGLWNVDTGAGGTVLLFPQQSSQPDKVQVSPADQLYTARHEFEPVKLDKNDIIIVANIIQQSFSASKVIVTYSDGAERSVLLDNFKQMPGSEKHINFLKLFARGPDFGGLDKIVQVEFGQQSNLAMTQGASEAWTLGELEKLKRTIGNLERSFITKKYYSFSFNQIMLAIAVIALPSINTIQNRTILVVAVIFLAFVVTKLHSKFLPHASIYMGVSKEFKFVGAVLGPIASWTLGLSANLVAALLAAYLAGYFEFVKPK